MVDRQPMNQLPPPPSALTDVGATEVLRAWIVQGGLHVSLIPGFDDPSLWGLMLVDIARHAARSYAAEGKCSEAEAMERIRALWNAEIAAPTDPGTTVPRND
jgi:hypothetical protein